MVEEAIRVAISVVVWLYPYGLSSARKTPFQYSGASLLDTGQQYPSAGVIAFK
jgi:hypothetical protein